MADQPSLDILELQPEPEAPTSPAHPLEAAADAAAEAAALDGDEREAWLRLAFVGLPANRCRTILERWGSPVRLLEAARAGRETALLETQGITPTTVERLSDAAERDLTPALEAMDAHDIRLILQDSPDYPEALLSIPDPPFYLFVRGAIEVEDRIAVAIVGTRHATEYGRGVAEKLAKELAQRGVTVVSGLARGVDTAAHRGALDAGGRTFAVCGCGLDIVYPLENKNLMTEIERNGANFSEFAPTVHPEPWHFPARNRIISGLSAGVIVVEAGERSGALITSDFALEQNREVFAVPGNIYKPQCRGTHGLIKQGATLVESADDVINALNNRTLPFAESPAPVLGNAPSRATSKKSGAPGKAAPVQTAPGKSIPSVRPDLSATENRLYLAMDVEPRHADEIAALAQMGAAEASATLIVLEMKGIARRLPGNVFVRVV